MNLLEKKALEKIYDDYVLGYNELSEAFKELNAALRNNSEISIQGWIGTQIDRIESVVEHYGRVKEWLQALSEQTNA